MGMSDKTHKSDKGRKMFPTAHSTIYRNEAGEPTGWDIAEDSYINDTYDDSFNSYEPYEEGDWRESDDEDDSDDSVEWDEDDEPDVADNTDESDIYDIYD